MARRRFPDAESRRRYWLEHVSRWASSGQSIAGYCSDQDLSEGCFHYWKSTLRRRDAQESSGEIRPAFAELQLVAPQRTAIEIAVGEGRCVQVHPGFDEETLARVLAVLERAS